MHPADIIPTNYISQVSEQNVWGAFETFKFSYQDHQHARPVSDTKLQKHAKTSGQQLKNAGLLSNQTMSHYEPIHFLTHDYTKKIYTLETRIGLELPIKAAGQTANHRPRC